MASSTMPGTGSIIAQKYKMIRKLGSGSFGDIFLCTENSNGDKFAVKVETRKKSDLEFLNYESQVYKYLSGSTGIPRAYFYGVELGYSCLVMDLLGPSIEELFTVCSRRFSLKTVLMLADQMIGRVEYLHQRRLIHRDLKPDNFLMGLGKEAHKLYIIDFGLVKQYIDHNKTHIAYKDGKNLIGTARYASLNAHKGFELSRRDDLESLGYSFMYFIRGTLPWQGLRGADKKEKYEKIAAKKTSTRASTLCKGFPDEFVTYIEYCRNLQFDETPDYMYVRQLFRELFRRSDYLYDSVFDWTLKPKTTSNPYGKKTTVQL
jgi:casein kinase 1 alpha